MNDPALIDEMLRRGRICIRGQEFDPFSALVR
jgi:hypothetical protein